MTKSIRVCASLGLTALLVVTGLSVARAEDEPRRSIVHIAGDLYRYQNNFHYSVFLITPEGAVVTDPINADTAQWLKGEIQSRFGQPVKYVIYSHSHPDHIAGGEVFADTATVVAHERAKTYIVENNYPTAVPDQTFSDQTTIEVGDKSIELTYPGPSHSDDLILMRFMPERVVFAVDMVAVNRVPWRDLPGADLDGWIAALKVLEGMDFDILSPGHGPMGTRLDVAPHRHYFEDLRTRVGYEMRAGKSVDEIKEIVTMDDYSHWLRHADWRALNVEGMVRLLSE